MKQKKQLKEQPFQTSAVNLKSHYNSIPMLGR